MSAKKSWLGSVCVAVSCVVVGPQPAAAPTERPDWPEVRIIVFSPAPVQESDRDRARHIARELLRAAAIRAVWQDCAAAPCESRPAEAGSVTVLILNDLPGSEPDACGRAAGAPGGQAGTVFVDWPCVRRVAEYAKRTLAGKGHPAASGLTGGDLLGAVIAHEVGHLLGLAHARTGVMRARIRVEELVALQAGKLAFSPADAATLRTSLERAPATRAALSRTP